MEKKLNALIVDDEHKARDLLEKLLEESLCFSEIRQADSIDSACAALKNFVPDIIFLDVRMPGKDGFCFFEEMPPGLKNTEIVFVTAYDQYAIQAIKKNAFDYLLKPVNRAELNQCITKLVEKRKNHPEYENPSIQKLIEKKPGKLRIAIRNGVVFIDPDHILYCQADGNYTSICTGDKLYTCSLNLGKVEELLPENGFIRIGRSLVFNCGYICSLDRKKCEVGLCSNNETVSVKVPRQCLNELDKVFH